MSPNERVLLLTCTAILVGRFPTALSAEDKAFLVPLVGDNDWGAVQAQMLALIRSVVEGKT